MFVKGQTAWNKGKCHSEEVRRKISMSRQGVLLSDKHKQAISASLRGNQRTKGHHLSAEHRKKIGEAERGVKHWSYGKKRPLTTRQKISKSKKGKPSWNLGKHFSLETREKIRKARTGTHLSLKTRRKIGNAQKGKKNWGWKGGVSFEPYTTDWTDTLRRSIRERDHYVCQLCGALQSDKTFCVHHKDYIKSNCSPDNLITLCSKCHLKTNENRKYWKNYFIYRTKYA